MGIRPNSIIKFIRQSKKTIFLIIIVSLTTLLLSTIISMWLSTYHNMRFPSIGTIRVIGAEAYGGNITTQDGKQLIDWGIVYLGNPVNCSFYIRSLSNEPVTLNLSISSVTFLNSEDQNVTETLPIENPLRLTWNYSNTSINPNGEIYVTLTLEATSDPSFIKYIINNDVKKFSFDIIIKPVEQ